MLLMFAPLYSYTWLVTIVYSKNSPAFVRVCCVATLFTSQRLSRAFQSRYQASRPTNHRPTAELQGQWATGHNIDHLESCSTAEKCHAIIKLFIIDDNQTISATLAMS